MTLSGDSVLALKRHFLGALRERSALWLEPAPTPQMSWSSDSLWRGVVELGTVESPGIERRIVRFANIGEGAVTLSLLGAPPWLDARWWATDSNVVELGSNGADLVLTAEHDLAEETLAEGVIRLQPANADGASRVVEIGVRMRVRRTQPLGIYDFHGSREPRAHDFVSGVYEISFDNGTAVPLTASFADLPAWVALTVDGHTRHGPAPGKFFERRAPFRATLWARAIPGTYAATIRIETNDSRARYQSMELSLSAAVDPASAFVRVRSSHQPRDLVTLENYGRSPARLEAGTIDPAIELQDVPVIPPMRDGSPGTAVLPLRIRPERLNPGTHELFARLRVLEGDPPEVTVPIRVTVASARQPPVSAIAVDVVMGIAAVLLLVVWVFMRGIG